jgi:hypothetical protein
MVRGAPFEMPDHEYERIVIQRWLPGGAEMTFESSGGTMVKLDDRRAVILRVRPRDADEVLPTWDFDALPRDKRTTLWQRP